MKESEYRAQAAQGMAFPEPGRQDKIGPASFLVIRHLRLEYVGQANRRHAGPPQHALPLHESGCRHNEHIIAAPVTGGFEQQRHVEHNDRLVSGAGQQEKTLFLGRNHRMKDALKPLQCGGVAEDTLPENPAVDSTGLRPDSWERTGDSPDRGSAGRQQPMHRLISVENRHTKAAQHRRGSALTHTNRAGKPEHNQCEGAKLSIIAARSSAVTRAGAPNQASKPGRP
jgi:hypothetical protein